MELGELLVLVIDNSSETVDLWKMALTLAGFAVATAANAFEGLRDAARLSPAAIVTELYLPDMRGEELVRELKERCNETPIIAVTTQAFRWTPDAAKAIGCNALLFKPCSPERLIRNVVQAVERRTGPLERRRIARGGRRNADSGHRRRS